ncbi:hypothetical protein CLU79DRAFT_840651 [Phycomyces nitens]|nr:hypothetical protein CLU79DRAFT_840651 [Phycomyces nitens]
MSQNIGSHNQLKSTDQSNNPPWRPPPTQTSPLATHSPMETIPHAHFLNLNAQSPIEQNQANKLWISSNEDNSVVFDITNSGLDASQVFQALKSQYLGIVGALGLDRKDRNILLFPLTQPRMYLVLALKVLWSNTKPSLPPPPLAVTFSFVERNES